MEDVREQLPGVINALLHTDTETRRKIVDGAFVPDAVFEHPFFVIGGRDRIFWLYEFWADVTGHKAQYYPKDIVLSDDGKKAVVEGWTHVRPYFGLPLLPTQKYFIITDVDLEDAGSGRKYIKRQVDHHMWLTSIAHSIPVFNYVYKRFERDLRRTNGFVITQLTRDLYNVIKKVLTWKEEVQENLSETVGTISEKVGAVKGQAQEHASQLASTLQQRTGELTGTVKDRTGQFQSNFQDRAAQLQSTLQDKAGQAQDIAQTKAGQAQSTLHSYTDTAKSRVQT